MDTWITLNKEKKGKLPFLSLPIYRLLCEQVGFRTWWDQKERSLRLAPSLQGKYIYIITSQEEETLSVVLEYMEKFFGNLGVHLARFHSTSSPKEKGEVCLRFKWQPSLAVHGPRFLIRHSPGSKGEAWAKLFSNELNTHGFTTHIKVHPKRMRTMPYLELHCQFPEDPTSDKKAFQESISYILISSLLKGLTQGKPLSLLPYLTPEILNLILPFPMENPSSMSSTTYTPTNEHESQKTDHVTKQESTATTTELKANVYFDYQILVPNTEESPFLIFGHLFIQNSGTTDLVNPIICLHASPADKIKMKGQILPPKLAETMGVQSYDGSSTIGWQYLDDDWFQKAKERGEYWIRPIHPVRIRPNQTQSFSNFQLTIPRPKTSETFTVQGIVFFGDEHHKFPSQNRITLSF